jgi:hypothetical protein
VEEVAIAAVACETPLAASGLAWGADGSGTSLTGHRQKPEPLVGNVGSGAAGRWQQQRHFTPQPQRHDVVVEGESARTMDPAEKEVDAQANIAAVTWSERAISINKDNPRSHATQTV